MVEHLSRHQALLALLKQHGICEPRVLQALNQTPRPHFVEPAIASRSWENQALPIGYGQSISQPLVVGLMTQALLTPPCHVGKVLEIGTGSGYQCVVLAHIFTQVYTVERVHALLDRARDRFRALNVNNVRSLHGDGHEGWQRYAPYDAIMLTAACRFIPDALLAQLAPDGCLVAPLYDGPQRQCLVCYRRRGGKLLRESLMAVRFVPLVSGLS